MKEIKTITPEMKEFTANGRKYLIQEKITPERYKEYEKLVPKLTFGLSFQEVYAGLMKAYDHCNKQRFLDCGITLHNLMNGIKNIDDENRVHPAMMMAALFILRDDEDPTKYEEKLMLDKIADWQAEGFDMWSFFRLSLSSIRGFRETLIRYTQEIVGQMAEDLKEETT